ncbi:MAG: TauD/TfdA dioxygenase family protein [Gammaproteobacteria bacterium]
MAVTNLDIRPLTVAIGAEVHGVDLNQVDDETFAALRQALHEHLVLVFHDQWLEPEAHMALASRLGEMEVHEVFTPLDGHPEISVLEHDAERPPISDSWHSDVSYRPEPSMASVLYARVIPPNGGDTLWRSAYAAYDALSPPIQQMLEGLTAEHDFLQAYGSYFRTLEDGAERRRRAERDTPPVVHPVVVEHPVTGRRLLYVNPTFTSRIVELGDAESRALLGFLFEHLNRPEFHVRVKWRADDLVMWDNRATQHYATGDYFPEFRRMHRITVGGDVPRGVAAAARSPALEAVS